MYVSPLVSCIATIQSKKIAKIRAQTDSHFYWSHLLVRNHKVARIFQSALDDDFKRQCLNNKNPFCLVRCFSSQSRAMPAMVMSRRSFHLTTVLV